ncbi:ATP-dependent DNA helicase RecQ-like [Saccoglossus kowalevskii]|uniref:DNA 3'-5' helicase n=1 Tax=Saccoglossus kowalevskii TaxID=10224 RepID=A0ABM0MKT0_SACKO|nr:PREDICTED: Werner syndrome ATP-dependent helicase homolog [Saccoglossus kowalevskii]
METLLGYELKKDQLELITNIMNKRHTMGILPTGFGKSDVYITPPLLLDQAEPGIHHISLVVSPLKSLVMDQVANWSLKGIKCAGIVNRDEMEVETIEGLKRGRYSVIFMSPESVLEIDDWSFILESEIYTKGVCLVALDEAHVICTWGETFRPVYKRVGDFRGHFTGASLAILSATCTDKVQKIILNTLHLEDKEVFTIARHPDRTQTQTGRQWSNIMNYLGNHAYIDQKKNVRCRMVDVFHANVELEDQKRVLENFALSDSTIRCVVATVAFGMGINIPDVDLVLHWGGSNNILQYWQEVGRCGRDVTRKGEAYCYAVKTDIVRCDEDMKKLCNNLNTGKMKCLRIAILQELTIPEMDAEYLKGLTNRDRCTQACGEKCTCHHCVCCCICRGACPCQHLSAGV